MSSTARERIQPDMLECLKLLHGSNVKLLASFYSNDPSDIEVTLQLLPKHVKLVLSTVSATLLDAESGGVTFTPKIHDVIAAAHEVIMELAEQRIPDADVVAYLET